MELTEAADQFKVLVDCLKLACCLSRVLSRSALASSHDFVINQHLASTDYHHLDAMSSHGEKKCCVCGAPSTMRCSACSKAGVDLYFCSAEHQKLVSIARRVWGRAILTSRCYSQVWFAHKPVCGPLKADFKVLPDLTPFETRLLQLPSFLQTLPQRRSAPGSRYATIGEVIVRLERDLNLIPGSFMGVRARRIFRRTPGSQRLTILGGHRTCIA